MSFNTTSQRVRKHALFYVWSWELPAVGPPKHPRSARGGSRGLGAHTTASFCLRFSVDGGGRGNGRRADGVTCVLRCRPSAGARRQKSWQAPAGTRARRFSLAPSSRTGSSRRRRRLRRPKPGRDAQRSTYTRGSTSHDLLHSAGRTVEVNRKNTSGRSAAARTRAAPAAESTRRPNKYRGIRRSLACSPRRAFRGRSRLAPPE